MLNQSNANLINILNQMINKYGTNRQVKEYLKSKFIDKNLLSSYPIKILTKRLELETLDILWLVYLCHTYLSFDLIFVPK